MEVRDAARDLLSAPAGHRAAERHRGWRLRSSFAPSALRLEHGESTPFEVLQRGARSRRRREPEDQRAYPGVPDRGRSRRWTARRGPLLRNSSTSGLMSRRVPRSGDTVADHGPHASASLRPWLDRRVCSPSLPREGGREPKRVGPIGVSLWESLADRRTRGRRRATPRSQRLPSARPLRGRRRDNFTPPPPGMIDTRAGAQYAPTADDAFQRSALGAGNHQQGSEGMATIGKSVVVKGDLTGDEDMHIEGSIEGKDPAPEPRAHHRRWRQGAGRAVRQGRDRDRTRDRQREGRPSESRSAPAARSRATSTPRSSAVEEGAVLNGKIEMSRPRGAACRRRTRRLARSRCRVAASLRPQVAS